MRLLKDALVCLLLALSCSVALITAVLMWKMPKIVDAAIRDTGTLVIAEVDKQATATRQEVLAEAGRWEKDADGRLGGALAEIHGAAQNADSRTGEALQIVREASVRVDGQVSGLRADVGVQLKALNETVTMAVTPFAESASQVDDALPLWLDCQFNPSCAFNRYVGVSVAIEKTAQSIAKEAPQMTLKADSIAASADSIGQSVAKEAEFLTRPQTKMQQFRSWLLVVARIWGAL